ncbi:hypothetical protein, partial [Escherichia coli]|uniref:hypothetical protein n=2 Tax=Gammaproteobacteria TaxID=1236 RepID=UPI0022F00EF5
MTQTGRRSFLVVSSVLALASSAAAAAADSAAGQFTEWTGDSTVSRQMTLRQLGFRQPLVLSGQESQREVYL